MRRQPTFHRPLAVLTAAAMLLVGASVAAPGVAGAEAPERDATATPGSVPDRVVVSWSADAAADDRAAVADRHGLRHAETFEQLDLEVFGLPADASERAVAALADEPAVAVAELDVVIEPASDDPHFDKLWGLHNTGQDGGTPDVDIDAPEAWQTTRGSAEIVVAVVDTGVDITHPDLAGNIWVNPGEIAGNGIDDDGNGYVDDVNGWDFHDDDNSVYDDATEDAHGTHVAGTIAAAADNGIGVAGVAPNVTIMPVKALGGTDGSGTGSATAAAVDYARANGADVINASWGGSGGFALKRAITDAAGTAVVASAGNEGVDLDATSGYFPAAWSAESYGMPNILSVAAVERTGALASISSFGANSVDLGAPGVDIASTYPGGKYMYASGTSMAAPHGSGAAALLASEDGTLSGAQLVDRLKDGARALAALDGITTTGGLLNAEAALSVGALPGDLVDDSEPEPVSTTEPDAEPTTEPEPEPEEPTEPDPEPAPTEPPPYDGDGARSLERACPDVTTSGFTDVFDSSTHAIGVGCALEWGIFTGSIDGLFEPNVQLTRGQLASVLVRAIEAATGSTLPAGTDRFGDDDASVHEPAINKLAELGIVAGLDADTYGPGNPVTRGQFATMLARTYHHLVGTLPAGTDTFADDDGSVHEDAIDALVALGIVAGTADGTYQPGVGLVRDQSATMSARLVDALVEAGAAPSPTS